MLSRILPFLLLAAAGVLAWSLYANGTFNKLLSPTVTAVVLKRDMLEGQYIRSGVIDMQEISISQVKPGTVTFPNGTLPKDAEVALANHKVGTRIEKGAMLNSTMLGQATSFVVLRTTMEIKSGDNITLRNVEATTLDTAPPRGVIVFETDNEALSYVNESYDLAARGDIYSGKIMTVNDTAGGAEKVFVVRATKMFDRAQNFSIEGLEPAEISSRDLPRGAIAFPSANAANIFIATADRFLAAETLRPGGFITAEVIASDNGLTPLPSSDMPRTLAELAAYMTAFPDGAMIIDNSVMLDEDPREGGLVDIWIEDGRTGTADSLLGEIRLERIAHAVPVQIVYRDQQAETPKPDMTAPRRGTDGLPMPAPQGSADPSGQTGTDEGSEGASGQDEVVEDKSRVLYWVKLPPETTRSFTKAWKAPEKVAFVSHADINLVDEIGNGATCNADRCSVNRKASQDMKDVLSQLEPPAPDEIGVQMSASPLVLLETVGPELAAQLEANGYDTLQKVADISEAEIQQVVMQLNLSTNQVAFIRRQAQLIVATPETARQELGMRDAQSAD